MIFTLISFFLALGILITFHELGHYWVARWCGVKILRFSVGFGRVLIKRCDRHGTEWALSCLLYTSPSPRDYAASRMPSSA